VAENVPDVTDDNFEAEVLEAELPVMLDMWAPWCGPCRMVTPTIEDLAASNAGKIKACKVNVDDSPNTAAKYGINAIPTVMFFRDGRELQDLRLIGVQPKHVYQKAVDKVTAG